jgi:hypothetical protein
MCRFFCAPRHKKEAVVEEAQSWWSTLSGLFVAGQEDEKEEEKDRNPDPPWLRDTPKQLEKFLTRYRISGLLAAGFKMPDKATPLQRAKFEKHL